MFEEMQNIIKNGLELESIKAIGYPTLKHFEKVSNAFLKCSNLREWLESGYQDLYHTSQSFYDVLLTHFGYDWEKLEEEMQECQDVWKKTKFFGDFLFVETSANPSCQKSAHSIMYFGYAKTKKYVDLSSLNQKCNQKNLKETLKVYKDFIAKHYEDNEGSLLIFGRILGYRINILGKVCRFSIQGDFEKFLKIPICEEDRRPLFEKIKSKLEVMEIQTLGQYFPNVSLRNLKKMVDIFLECQDTQEYIGRATKAISAKEFFLHLAEVLFDEGALAWQEIKPYRNLLKRCEKFDSVIEVLTQNTSESMLQRLKEEEVSLLEESKKIYINRSMFCQKTQQEVFALIQGILSKHYQRNGGKLEVWGEIMGYKSICYQKECEFDTQGKITNFL